MSERPSRLVSLPAELWELIFQCLPPCRGYAYLYRIQEVMERPLQDESLQTLLMLSLVCRTFHTMIQPLIYHRVYIEASFVSDEKLFEVIQSMERLDALLKRCPQIASWIVEFDIGFPMEMFTITGMDSNDPPRPKSLMDLTLRILPKLTSLRTLTLSKIETSSPILQLIPQISSIRSLKIENLLGAQENISTSEPVSTGSSITHLTILAFGSRYYYIPLSAPMPFGNLFFGPALIQLDTNFDILYGYLHSTVDIRSCLPHVVSLRLSLTAEELPHLPEALETLQSVTCLIIDMMWPEVFPEDVHFTQRCVPALQEFTGPLGLAQCILPGRPITKVALQCTWKEERRVEEAIKFLERCTSVILELKVVFAIWSSMPILKEMHPVLRHIKRLEIAAGTLREDFLADLADFASSDCVLQELEEISWGTAVTDPYHQSSAIPKADMRDVEWLQRSLDAFPSLKTFICDGYCWSFDKGGWTESMVDNERQKYMDQVAALRNGGV